MLVTELTATQMKKSGLDGIEKIVGKKDKNAGLQCFLSH